MSLETMTKLATSTVGVGGAATIVFSNIPQNYTDLKIVLSARTAEATINSAGSMSFTASGDSLYSSTRLYGYYNGGSAIGSDGATGTGNITLGNIDGSNASSDAFTNTHIYVPNYTSSDYKTVYVESCMGSNSTNLIFTTLVSGLWSNTAPITTVLLSGSANWVRYTSATLYGVKNSTKTVGNSIKATGGAVSFDGTYVTHTFNTTDIFTPTTNLLVDYLVVAGGGAGGGDPTNRYSGGGGGAGGLRSTFGSSSGGGGSLESKSLLLSGSSYPITIGAGGAGTANQGNSGSNTTFLSITSTGGGGGGTANESASIGTRNGLAGGSGGGAGGGVGTVPSGGAGTANQGYAGANSGSYYAGGGGGAGGVGVGGGSNPTGGIGVALPIDGATRYFAGGGGGANGASAAAGGLGGGGSGGNIGVNGASGTGGGGGGSEQDYVSGGAFGGNGGSGIVIIRYKG